jgi:bifunctional DNA-binding transcriptional regulator/antitoxin component of YhaV-PrlF toxin-antitoxin module
MPRLKLHFDGWLSLPAPFRQQLGLDAGDALDAELVDGTIVLRPGKGSAEAVQGGIAPDAAAATPAPSVLAAQALSPEQLPAEPGGTPPPKRRGRPPKAKA